MYGCSGKTENETIWRIEKSNDERLQGENNWTKERREIKRVTHGQGKSEK